MQQLLLDKVSFSRDEVPLFTDVEASWPAGSIVQLQGANGAGKTTLLRIIAGLLRPSAGRVSFNEVPSGHYDFLSQLLYLGHQPGVKRSMTPLENLRWYFALNGLKGVQSSARPDEPGYVQALAKVGLRHYEDVPCYQLSAGQQRRVALARLFLSEAPLWLLDEPFTAVDVHGVALLEERIQAHAEQGGLVLLTTHQSWRVAGLEVLDLERFKASGARG